MDAAPLLLATVAAVGVLHTLVPDHWLPIAILARQEGWTRRETTRAAGGAGLGHSLSTLAIGIVVWLMGAALATRFTQTVDLAAGAALVGFGAWIAIGALRDLRPEGGHGHTHHGHTHHAHDHGHAYHGHDPGHAHDPGHPGHRHRHRHPDGREHAHYHEHEHAGWHVTDGAVALAAPPLHKHAHNPAPRRALMLILGSSPMVEGIPAFFAAARFGVGLLAAMAVVFTAATVATYVALCLYSIAGLERVNLGPFERYGEVLSGAIIAAVGLVFLLRFR